MNSLTEPTTSSDYDGPDNTCRVCGEVHASMHYGVMTCFGCKGFFRRALKRPRKYDCKNGQNCVIDRNVRNSCKFCRLQRCLKVGMNPFAVRPDRDFTGPHYGSQKFSVIRKSKDDSSEDKEGLTEWTKRLPLEIRTMLLTLLNIEARVIKGDTKLKAHELYPLPESTLRELVEDPLKLKGHRSEMRYEPYTMAKSEELLLIAYRRLIAAIDWVKQMADLAGGFSLDDKIALIKNCFAPLLVFNCAVRTAEVTDDPNVLCLCNFSFVPRNTAKAYKDSYHLENGLVNRALDELVAPLRNLKLIAEEIVCLNAIIVLNPHIKDLSYDGSQKVADWRNKVQDAFFYVIKETKGIEHANIHYGNLLFFLPIVTEIAIALGENLQFAQTFSSLGRIPLLTNIYGSFPVEAFSFDRDIDTEMADASSQSLKLKKTEDHFLVDKSTQTYLTIGIPRKDVFHLVLPPREAVLYEMLLEREEENWDEDVESASTIDKRNPDLTGESELVDIPKFYLPNPGDSSYEDSLPSQEFLQDGTQYWTNNHSLQELGERKLHMNSAPIFRTSSPEIFDVREKEGSKNGEICFSAVPHDKLSAPDFHFTETAKQSFHSGALKLPIAGFSIQNCSASETPKVLSVDYSQYPQAVANISSVDFCQAEIRHADSSDSSQLTSVSPSLVSSTVGFDSTQFRNNQKNSSSCSDASMITCSEASFTASDATWFTLRRVSTELCFSNSLQLLRSTK